MTDSLQPPSPASIRKQLDRHESANHTITVTIQTTNDHASSTVRLALINLFTDVLITDPEADIDFEQASTTRTHFDTHPF